MASIIPELQQAKAKIAVLELQKDLTTIPAVSGVSLYDAATSESAGTEAPSGRGLEVHVQVYRSEDLKDKMWSFWEIPRWPSESRQHGSVISRKAPAADPLAVDHASQKENQAPPAKKAKKDRSTLSRP